MQREKLTRMVVSKYFDTPTLAYRNSFKKHLAAVLNEVYTIHMRLFNKRLDEQIRKWKEVEEEDACMLLPL